MGIEVRHFTKKLEGVSVFLVHKVFESKNARKAICIPHKLKYGGWTLQITSIKIDKFSQSKGIAEKRLVISKLVLQKMPLGNVLAKTIESKKLK